jgi:hypothetical protein
MWLDALRRYLHTRSPRSRNRDSRPTPRQRPLGAHRPALEALEDRCLLTLAPAVNYTVGSYPLDVAVGQMNADDNPDLVTINGWQISVLAGNADGTFGTAQTTNAGTYLTSAAVGDINEDGKMDLVGTESRWRCTQYGYTGGYWGYWGYYPPTWQCVSSVQEGYAQVLLGNGDGTFQPRQEFFIDSNGSPMSAVLGDFDGDEDLDLAVGKNNWGTNVVSVLLGNGDGTFQSAQNTTVGNGPASLATGDFDNDDDLDLAVLTTGNNSVAVLLGNGDGTFQPTDTTSFGMPVHAVAVGDIDDDGLMDLAVTSSLTSCSYWGWYGCYQYSVEGYVNVMLGNGDGTTEDPVTTLANNLMPVDMVLADFNGDDKLDVATADRMLQAIDPTVLLGNGNGTFDTPYHFDAGMAPIGIVAADFNHDESPDLAVANWQAHTVSVFLNDNNWPALGAPFVNITDGAVYEGSDGLTNITFEVTLNYEYGEEVRVDYQTVNGSAVAGSDFVAQSDTLIFLPGETSKTITISVVTDRVGELDETFLVNLTGITNARAGDTGAFGTIWDDEPRISIDDVWHYEGNSGTTAYVFTVRLAVPYDEPVTVNYATGNHSATLGVDYQAVNTVVTIPAGETSAEITVLVNGDRIAEGYSEGFYVNLSNANYGMLTDSQGYGTIYDDEPYLYISDFGDYEGNNGSRTFQFTVRLSMAYDLPVTVNFATADGTATSNGKNNRDYQATSGTLTFAPNVTSMTINVTVFGDNRRESTEHFLVNLSGATNVSISDAQAWGYIYNDDYRG